MTLRSNIILENHRSAELLFIDKLINKKANMIERRRWWQTETELLIHLVKKKCTFLTGVFTPSKTKAMGDKKWSEITEAINALGCGSIVLTTDQYQKNGLI